MADLYAGLSYTDGPCAYVKKDGTYSRVHPLATLRPTDNMLMKLSNASLNPEIEPSWHVMLMEVFEDYECRVVPMDAECKTFSEACDGVIKSTTRLFDKNLAVFLRMDPKQETLQTMRKIKMFENFADKANMKILRYCPEMTHAVGVVLRLD